MKFLLAVILLASPLVALEYWLLGAVGGFRLVDKLSARWKRILTIYGWLALLSGGAAAGLASMHGCSLGGLHATPQLVDTAWNWRPLPQVFYVQPNVETIAPTPAVPPVAESTEVWTNASRSTSFTIISSATSSTSSTSFTVASPAVTRGGGSGGGTVWMMTTGGSYTMRISIDAQGNPVQEIVDDKGNVVGAATGMVGGSLVPDSRMAKMKSYPASKRPSDCVASCMSHHRSWVTPVEDSYCQQDTSNADGGFYGWVKEGSAWKPTIWPATNMSDERDPNLISLKPHEQISLTEGVRSY